MAQMVLLEREGLGKDTYKLGKAIHRNKNYPKEEGQTRGRLKKGLSILVVDDDDTIRELFRRLLESKGYTIDTASDGYKAVELARKKKHGLAFIDIVMPGMNGYLTFLEIKKINPGMKAVMMTGYSVDSIIKDALKKDAYTCINKPFFRDDVLSIIAKIEKELEGL